MAEKRTKISEAEPIDITGGMDSVDYVRAIRQGLDPAELSAERFQQNLNEQNPYVRADSNGNRFPGSPRTEDMAMAWQEGWEAAFSYFTGIAVPNDG